MTYSRNGYQIHMSDNRYVWFKHEVRVLDSTGYRNCGRFFFAFDTITLLAIITTNRATRLPRLVSEYSSSAHSFHCRPNYFVPSNKNIFFFTYYKIGVGLGFDDAEKRFSAPAKRQFNAGHRIPVLNTYLSRVRSTRFSRSKYA